MHSHLIPGIDDGAKTMEDSVLLIRRLVDMGYRKIITTPHIMQEFFPNTPIVIRKGLEKVKAALQAEGIQVELEAAAEYFVDESFEALLQAEEEILHFSNKHVLIESSLLAPSNNIFDAIFQLKTKGYQPILAHPERYVYYADQWEVFERIHEMGCKMQVNLLSLAGHYGPAQKKLGVKLLKSGWIEFLGTDLHREGHLKKLNALWKDRTIRKLIQDQAFSNREL